jgi:hypothetical protein
LESRVEALQERNSVDPKRLKRVEGGRVAASPAPARSGAWKGA